MKDQLATSMLKYILAQKSFMENGNPLQSWAQARAVDFILSCFWLLDYGQDVITGYEQDLLDVANLAYKIVISFPFF